MSSITIRDVAKLANVSVSTVSRVINGGYPVSDDKRQSVLDAIVKLRYTPNTMAVSLRNRRTNTIGMIVPRITNATYSKMISGVENTVKEAGYKLLLSSTNNDLEQEKGLLESMQSRMVDAVLLSSSSTVPYTIMEQFKSIAPLILLDRRIDGANLDVVASNDRESSFQLVDYLFKVGHRRIAIVKGVNQLSVTKDRLAGYIDAHNQNAVAPDAHLQLNCDFTEESAYEAVNNLFSVMRPADWPTAIYSTNTSMTEGTMQAIYQHGLKIPQDISVVSFGQPSLPCFFEPQITCVERNAEKMGEVAGQVITRRIQQFNSGKPFEVETFIIHSDIHYGSSVRELI